MTPSELNIKKGTVIPPKDGWKKQSVYLVEVAFSSHNVIHHELFFTGFISDGKPAGYNGFAVFGKTDDYHNNYNDAYYLKAIKRLCHENQKAYGKIICD